MTDIVVDMEEEMEVDNSSDEGADVSPDPTINGSVESVDLSSNGSGDESANKTGIEKTIAVGNGAKEAKEYAFEVSFFKINLDHHDLNRQRRPISANASTIVDKYNEKFKTEIEKRNRFVPEISTYKTQLFEVKLYVQTSEGQHKLLEMYGVDQRVNNYNIVIFFCNTDSVYAVTQRQGYRLIERYIDYKFPQNISRRLLSEEGMIKHKSVNLYGNARSTEETLIKGRPTSLLSFQICIEFYARLCSDASIRKKVKSFGTKDIKVNIGLGKIRFLNKIEASHYPSILSHLDLIDRGGLTYTCFADKDKKLRETLTVEKDSDSFTNFVQKVSNVKHKELNSDLTERIRQNLLLGLENVSEGMSLDNFYVCHKNYDDFSRGTDFTLVFKTRNKKCNKTFEMTPTLSEILNELIEWNQRNRIFTDINDKDLFANQLNKVNLSFKNIDIPTEDKLINCIEGEVLLTSTTTTTRASTTNSTSSNTQDQYFWRRRRIWYCILGDSLRVIHNEFIKVLNKDLMKDSDEGNLMTLANAPVWRSAEIEKTYNDKFKQGQFKQNFLCMDGQLTNEKLELFDLMSYYKPKGFIYHIKKGFNKEMRAACSQLRNSAQFISSTIRLTNTSDQNLRDYYKKGMKKEYEFPKNYPEFVNTFEKFKTILSDPNLTFVLAIAINSLEEEKAVKQVLKSTDLKELYYKHKSDLIKAQIPYDSNSFINIVINGLMNGNYLKELGNDYEVTSKLLFCDKLSLSSFTETQNKTIRDILSPYRSRYGTVGPMMDVIHLKKEIESFSYTFRICEIAIE